MKYNPNTREKLQIVMNDYETFGLFQAFKHVLMHFLANPETFDRRNNVITDGDVSETNLTTPADIDFANYSGAVSEKVMTQILRTLADKFDPREYTFVDLGSGKGRALLIASQLPFREIIGVEVSPQHCQATRGNIAAFLERKRSNGSPPKVACPRINVRCTDAGEFEYPESNIVVLMHNPFQGPLFRKVLDRLCSFRRRTGRRVWIVLARPISEFHLRRSAEFILHEERQHIFFGYSWNLWECSAEFEPKAASAE